MKGISIKYFLLAIQLFTPFIVLSQSARIGAFDHFSEIGSPAIQGSASFQDTEQVYHLGGSGSNIWFDHDSFSFLWKSMQGDFTLEAEVEFVGKGKEPHRKTGFMIRTSKEPDAPMIAATLHGDGLTALQWRPAKGDNVQEIQFETSAPDRIKLEKKGNSFIMSVGKNGMPYQEMQKVENQDLGDSLMVGLYICSHNDEYFEEVDFSEVQIIP